MRDKSAMTSGARRATFAGLTFVLGACSLLAGCRPQLARSHAHRASANAGTGEDAEAPLVESSAGEFVRQVWVPFASGDDAPPESTTRAVVCGDVPDDRCARACSGATTPRAHAACVTAVRWADAPEIYDVASELFARTGAVLGIETRATIDGAHLGEVRLLPATPSGPYRHHVDWLAEAIGRYERLFVAVTQSATAPVEFRTRPLGFRFYRTEQRSFPSAYALEGVVAYNVEGELHTTAEDVASTLFHELFHLNDQSHGDWAERTLSPIFDSIREHCADDHGCFSRYAPDNTQVPDGTYYAFDSRTGSVREYGAELALRWFHENETALASGTIERPFKCDNDQNGAAWQLLVGEFFGGGDLVGDCPHAPTDGVAPEGAATDPGTET